MSKKLVCVISFFLSFQMIHAQEDVDLYQGRTLEEIKQEIQTWIDYLPEYLSVIDPLSQYASDNQLEPVDESTIEDAISAYKVNPYQLSSIDQMKNDIRSSLKSISFLQQIQNAGSTVIFYDSWWQIKLLAEPANYQSIKHDSLAIKKIYYKNGTVEAFSKPFNGMVPNRKVIDSVEVATKAYSPVELKKVNLSAKTPIVYLGKDTIQVHHIGPRLALIQVSSNQIQLIDLLGKTKDGSLIRSEDNNYSDFDLEQRKKTIVDETEWMKNLLVKLENKEFADAKTFYNVLENERLAFEKQIANERKVYRYGYQYALPVESFDLYYIDRFETIQLTATLLPATPSSSVSFFVASEGDNYGLVDINGEWLVQPTYSYLSHQEDNFLMSLDDESNTITLVYDEMKKELKKVNYSFHQKIAKDRYHVIENDKSMVVNSASEIIIPPSNFTSVEYHEGAQKFIVQDAVGYSLYDSNGTLALPEKYQSITIDKNNFIQLVPISRTTVYNLQMKKLSDNTWVDAEECAENSGLLCVSNEKGEICFVNTKGEVVIKSNSAYEFDKSYSTAYFENGFCAVRSSDYLYGCIDMKGNLIVPIEYAMLFTFGKKYVCASKEDLTVFYDKTGRIVKSIPSAVYTYEYSAEGELSYNYILQNGEVYDVDGNFVRKDESYEQEYVGEDAQIGIIE